MSKQVIVRLDGGGFYENLEKASEAFGMTPGNISRAISETGKVRGVPVRWADRVFAVKERVSGRWVVAVRNGRNSAYLPVDQAGETVLARNVCEIRELTAVWYLR